MTGRLLAFRLRLPECTQLAYIIPNFNSLSCHLFIFNPPCAMKWKRESTTSCHISVIILPSWWVKQNLMQGSKNFFEFPICSPVLKAPCIAWRLHDPVESNLLMLFSVWLLFILRKRPNSHRAIHRYLQQLF